MSKKNLCFLGAIVCLAIVTQLRAATTGVAPSFLPSGFTPETSCARTLRTAFADNYFLETPEKLADMARLSELSVQYFTPYLRNVRGPVLEVGPYFHPVTDHFPTLDDVFYWDLDLGALEFLNDRHLPGRARSGLPMFIDLDRASDGYREAFTEWNRTELRRRGKASFRAIFISQVLNYVDYRETLAYLSRFQLAGDLLFLNNRINDGFFPYFNLAKNPQSWVEIQTELQLLGYRVTVLAKRPGPVLPSGPTAPRIIAVAEKLGGQS